MGESKEVRSGVCAAMEGIEASASIAHAGLFITVCMGCRQREKVHNCYAHSRLQVLPKVKQCGFSVYPEFIYKWKKYI